MALKKFINIGARLVDSGYRGELGVVLYNHSEDDCKVNEGYRVAQLSFEMIKAPVLQKCKPWIKRTKVLRDSGVLVWSPRERLSWVKRVKHRKRKLNLLKSDHSSSRHWSQLTQKW